MGFALFWCACVLYVSILLNLLSLHLFIYCVCVWGGGSATVEVRGQLVGGELVLLPLYGTRRLQSGLQAWRKAPPPAQSLTDPALLPWERLFHWMRSSPFRLSWLTSEPLRSIYIVGDLNSCPYAYKTSILIHRAISLASVFCLRQDLTTQPRLALYSLWPVRGGWPWIPHLSSSTSQLLRLLASLTTSDSGWGVACVCFRHCYIRFFLKKKNKHFCLIYLNVNMYQSTHGGRKTTCRSQFSRSIMSPSDQVWQWVPLPTGAPHWPPA